MKFQLGSSWGHSAAPVKILATPQCLILHWLYFKPGAVFALRILEMIRILTNFLVLAISLGTLTSQAGPATYCQMPTQELSTGETILHPGLLGALHQKAKLKLAQRLSLENLNTVESYAYTLSTRLNKEAIADFKATYLKYAHEATYDAFISNLKKADYWKPELRLNNSQVAMVAVLATHRGEISLTSSELESLWISQNWPIQDELLLSKQLVILTGAVTKKRQLTVAEYQSVIKTLVDECVKGSDSEIAKALRDEFWLLANKSFQYSKNSLKADGTVFAELPTLRLPDQTLHQGSLKAIQLATYEKQNFRDYFKQRNQINEKSDLEVIEFFHKNYARSPYVVVDKKRNLISYYNDQANLLSQNKIESFRGDELNTGGAGIYFYSGQTAGYHYLQAQKDLLIRAAFRGNVSLQTGAAIYILPETADHHFRIRNRQISFGSAKVFRNRPAYNYTPLMSGKKAIAINVNMNDEFAKTFAKALQDEKLALMEIMKVEDDEYNMLAEFAFGVMSPETEYGRNWKYRVKEMAPVIVSLLKGNGLNTDENSRGPTQVKRIPEAVIEKYKIDKGDLKEPRAAAIATVAFSAELLRDLRNVAYLHSAIKEENLQEYLYYLYQGRRWEIRNATATPDKNANIRKIMKAIELLTITEP